MMGRWMMVVAFAATAGANAGAQGSLGGVGLGYPGGQLSARARATGGALGEFDAHSGLNPASITRWQRSGLFFQYEPEYRRTVVGGAEDWIRIHKFPVAAMGLRWRSGVVLGINVSTLLDRRWQTSIDRTETVGGQPVTYEEVTNASGSITDIRFAAGWNRGERLAIGGGFHAYTGENESRVVRDYETAGFGTFSDASTRAYNGFGLSVGAEYRLARPLRIGGSWRQGLTMRSYRSDTAMARGRVPDRFAGAVAYDGIGGVTIGATVSWTEWSALEGLLGPSTEAHDSWEVGIGVEAQGPKWFEESIPVRAGIRTRTLPFTQSFDVARELGIAAGFGIPIARGRATLDFGGEWARRTSVTDGCEVGGCVPVVFPADVKERTWTFSFGVAVRQ